MPLVFPGRLQMLLDNQQSAAAGDTFSPQLEGARARSEVVQVKVSGTATVQLQGRLSSDFDWEVIKEYTASGVDEITVMPEMRAEVTAYTSGGVWVGMTQ